MCCWFVCLLVAPVKCVSSYCFCWLIGKDKDVITPCRRGSGLIRWSPEQGFRGQRKDDEQTCLSELKWPSENDSINSEFLQVDSTWPSLVSMVLMRTFLVVEVSMWGLESIIVSKTEKYSVVLITCNVINNTINSVKSRCKRWSYLSGLETKSLAVGWRFCKF